MLYHVNPTTGNPSKCRAQKGKCPFATEHFSTAKEASRAWEKLNELSLVSKKKTLVISDIDGTLVRSSLVLTNAVELHEAGLIDLGETPAQWKTDMKNETLIIELATAYKDSLAGKTVAFVKAHQTVERLLTSDKNFYSTLKRLIDYKKNGAEVVLISGSPDFIVKPFAERFGFKYHASIYHKDENKKFTGEVTLMASEKAKQAVINDLNLDQYDEIIGMGDTSSDTPLLRHSHRSILVDPTDETLASLKEKKIEIHEIVRD
jgi:HAD superfamily phosphoserine phosphatase-like hydrolase